MGLKSKISSSYFASTPFSKPVTPNPDPYKFEVLERLVKDDFLLLRVAYKDCTNYEGVKFLLYQGVTLAEILKQGAIDPHFSDNKQYIHPIARFEPSHRGLNLAMKCMNS